MKKTNVKSIDYLYIYSKESKWRKVMIRCTGTISLYPYFQIPTIVHHNINDTITKIKKLGFKITFMDEEDKTYSDVIEYLNKNF
jgi:hypothetical protein